MGPLPCYVQSHLTPPRVGIIARSCPSSEWPEHIGWPLAVLSAAVHAGSHIMHACIERERPNCLLWPESTLIHGGSPRVCLCPPQHSKGKKTEKTKNPGCKATQQAQYVPQHLPGLQDTRSSPSRHWLGRLRQWDGPGSLSLTCAALKSGLYCYDRFCSHRHQTSHRLMMSAA